MLTTVLLRFSMSIFRLSMKISIKIFVSLLGFLSIYFLVPYFTYVHAFVCVCVLVYVCVVCVFLPRSSFIYVYHHLGLGRDIFYEIYNYLICEVKFPSSLFLLIFSFWVDITSVHEWKFIFLFNFHLLTLFYMIHLLFVIFLSHFYSPFHLKFCFS